MYNVIYLTESTNDKNEAIKSTEAEITAVYKGYNFHHAMQSITRYIQKLTKSI